MLGSLFAVGRLVASRILSPKGTTAREANRVLGRTGEPFWQKESYDHWVRDGDELEKIRAYIESNPVKAGLARNPKDFAWSSASVEKSLDAARMRAPRLSAYGGLTLLEFHVCDGLSMVLQTHFVDNPIPRVPVRKV